MRCFRTFPILTLALLCSGFALAQTLSTRPEQPARSATPSAPNSDPTYAALRHVAVSAGDAIDVTNFTLKKDAGTFTFARGTFYLLAPVAGKVTGAVFVGSGSFTVKPPTASEERNLRILTGGGEYVEEFDKVVLRFSDGTDAELRKAGSVATGGNAGDAHGTLNEFQEQLRTKLQYNLTARLLQDVLSPEPVGMFIAYVKGKRYSGHTLFVIDPHGVGQLTLPLAPEEVALMTYDETKFGVWASFHLADEYKNGTATSTQKNAFIDITKQELDTTIEKSARLEGKAVTTFLSGVEGLRVVVFDLF